MNLVTPNFTEIKSGLGKFLGNLGIIPAILLAVIAVAVLFYAGAGVSNWFGGWQADRKIEALQQEAAQYKQQAEAERAEKEQYKGAAAAYAQQAAQENQVLVELLNERPELQNRINTATRKVEAARNQKPIPVDNRIRERVDALGSKLDRLFPDK